MKNDNISSQPSFLFKIRLDFLKKRHREHSVPKKSIHLPKLSFTTSLPFSQLFSSWQLYFSSKAEHLIKLSAFKANNLWICQRLLVCCLFILGAVAYWGILKLAMLSKKGCRKGFLGDFFNYLAPKTWVQYFLSKGFVAIPTPNSLNSGRRMFSLCPGEFIKASTASCIEE